ncbi:hypothetical protein KY330_05825 [Candidatus Woesearchaeota archaeon]|nr:hypothetical protein [Candidatus Woesearchaeota archaeon]
MNLALNPFGKGKKPESVDTIEEVVDEAVDEVYKKFFGSNFCNTVIYDVSEYKKLNLPALRPSQIQMFLDSLKASWLYQNAVVGNFVSRLLQQSYEAGNDDFNLDLMFPMTDLLNRVDVPLSLTVYGNVITLGHMCKGVEVEVNGNVLVSIGSDCKDSKFFVYGDVKSSGCGSNNCIYYITGNVEEMYGFLTGEKCIYYVNYEVYKRHIDEVPWSVRLHNFLFEGNEVNIR